MAKRVEQIESTLQRALSQTLQRDLADPRLQGAMVSITSVKVSPDLHHATVNISVLPDTAQRRALAALRHAAAHIASLTRKRVALRLVPHLTFRLDESLKKQAKIHEAINQAIARTGPAPEPSDAAPDQPSSESPGDDPHLGPADADAGDR